MQCQCQDQYQSLIVIPTQTSVPIYCRKARVVVLQRFYSHSTSNKSRWTNRNCKEEKGTRICAERWQQKCWVNKEIASNTEGQINNNASKKAKICQGPCHKLKEQRPKPKTLEFSDPFNLTIQMTNPGTNCVKWECVLCIYPKLFNWL